MGANEKTTISRGTAPMPKAPILRNVHDRIRVVDLQWIPTSDGRRRAGRLWIPNDAEKERVRAILEYIPYRRRDGARIFSRSFQHKIPRDHQ